MARQHNFFVLRAVLLTRRCIFSGYAVRGAHTSSPVKSKKLPNNGVVQRHVCVCFRFCFVCSSVSFYFQINMCLLCCSVAIARFYLVCNSLVIPCVPKVWEGGSFCQVYFLPISLSGVLAICVCDFLLKNKYELWTSAAR